MVFYYPGKVGPVGEKGEPGVCPGMSSAIYQGFLIAAVIFYILCSCLTMFI